MSAYDADGHVKLSLGLYALGALREDHCVDVAEHLVGCSACRAELRELQEATFALALLSAEDVRELAGMAPVEGGHPAGRPRPSARRQPHRAWRMAAGHARVAVLAAVFAMVISIGAGVYLRASDTAAAPPATTLAAADDSATGVSLSVKVYGQGDSAWVHATVGGLRPDETYRLSVLTVNGAAHLVRRWAGPDGAQTIVADVAVPAASMSYFRMTEQDGTVVMLAWCQPGPDAAATPSR